MRAAPPLLLLSLFCACPSLAGEVRVRIYSAHPPKALIITAVKGQLHWKTCRDCEQQTGQQLIFPLPATEAKASGTRSEEHTSELQSHSDLVCRLLLEKKK